jgi:hypothetical protein
MEHTISSTPIYFSKEYKKFSFITGNRTINETKVKRIIKDIDEGLNMLKYCPIVVTKDMKIIDGQHRYTVCKILKCPVHYIIADEITLNGIAKVNSRTERWKPIDFVKCYIETGNKDYEILMRFIVDYDLPVSSALYLLNNGIAESNSSKIYMDAFERGQFKAKHEKEAEHIMTWINQFDEFSGRTTRHFITAICILLRANKCDMNELMSKYNAKKEALDFKGSYKEYLINLEEIYNRNMQKRRVIY